MNNNGISNPLNGQNIGHFHWPFYRYKAIIPNQLGGDILVWLYLSLVVFINENHNTDRDNYNNAVKDKVKLIINKNFSNIIDSQTLEAVISNAEKDYITDNIIKKETFDFLETFRNLFSDTCETRMVYQDAVTGEVLPFFDNAVIYDSKTEDKGNNEDIKNTKEPSSIAIKRAYEQYMTLKRFNNLPNGADLEFENDYYDEEEQTFLDNEDDDFSSTSESTNKEEKQSLVNMDVILIPDSKVALNINMPVYIKDNKLAIQSPFGRLTDGWLTKCLLKWKNISEQRYIEIKEFEKIYCIEEERKAESFKEAFRGDFASTLKYCASLYRLIDSLNNDKIRYDVAILDEYFKIKNPDVYTRMGKILEFLVKEKIKYNMSSYAERLNIKTSKEFYKLFDHKFQYSSVYYDRLTNWRIYNDWKNKLDYDGTIKHRAFKADVADIILKTDIIKSPKIYDSFIKDLIYLYDKRNENSHYSGDDIEIDNEDISKLTKVVTVLFELI